MDGLFFRLPDAATKTMLAIGIYLNIAVTISHGLLDSSLHDAGINPNAIFQATYHYCRFI
jgi:hypothetical protein